MAVRQFHLWREFPTAPFVRFACTVEADNSVDSGYTIIDYDYGVADAGWLHQLAEHMARPVQALGGGVVKDTAYDAPILLQPGDEGFIGAAVRTAPNAICRTEGRS